MVDVYMREDTLTHVRHIVSNEAIGRWNGKRKSVIEFSRNQRTGLGLTPFSWLKILGYKPNSKVPQIYSVTEEGDPHRFDHLIIDCLNHENYFDDFIK